jgi:hypothetical protein
MIFMNCEIWAEGNPYLISTRQHLELLNTYITNYGSLSSVYFKVTRPIDLGGKNWTPIGGSTSTLFSGTFDGGDHAISNMTINNLNASRPEMYGFFATHGGTIKNVNLTGVNVNIGSATVVGSITGINGGTIMNCKASGKIVSDATRAGGLVGDNGFSNSDSNTTKITNSNVNVDVSGNMHVGGLAGYSNALIEKCKSSGSVKASGFEAGGLVGRNAGAVTNSSAIGKVTGNYTTGGLLGQHYGDDEILNNTFSQSGTGQKWGIGEDTRKNPPVPSNTGVSPLYYTTALMKTANAIDYDAIE